MKLKKQTTVLAALCGILCVSDAIGQPGPPPPPPPCWPPPCGIPINNGILFLLAAGLLLGIYAFYKAQRKSSL